MTTNIVAFDRQAVQTSVDLAARISVEDLTLPTPCAAWTLHGLLAHMTTQHHGFAAASSGDGDPALWKQRSLGEDPAATYRAAAEHVLEAFSADGVLDRSFPLPEFTSGSPFPGARAIGFHFIDYVVHSWDLAKTLGIEVDFEPELLEAALVVARAVPDGAARVAPGAAFAPALAWRGGSRLDEIVAILGRSPDWTNPRKTL
ncbi:TIGR03086 family metal-binding protein [Nonomuraea sp. NPDC002799]